MKRVITTKKNKVIITKKNNMFIRNYWRWLLLGFLILVIWLIRFLPSWGEWYARHIYPGISSGLSSFSSLFPFSIGDTFIFCSLVGIVVYPLWGLFNRIGWKKIVFPVGEYLLWIYVWFYFAWGLNYFRQPFYSRTEIPPAVYSADQFRTFLDKYVMDLNDSWVPEKWVEHYRVDEEIKKGYQEIYKEFGLCRPKGWQRGKTMLFSSFISKVGVSGYMGPFFSEFHLNGELLASQYPSTYAHEMAHLLGISSEAEANLYAYLVCTASSDSQIRFSGYFSLFSHVLRNMHRLLSEEEYKEVIGEVNPEIIRLYLNKQEYWAEKYSPFIGDIQDKVYDWFLKGNQIQSGKENYSQVIGLLISLNAFREGK